MLAWDLDINNPRVTKPIWLRLIMRRPRLIRYYVHWRKSLLTNGSPLQDQIPWVEYEAIDWLQSYLKPGMQVFEWGAGGSTLFFARRIDKVIAIEHDPVWHAAIAEVLHRHDIHNVTLLLREPDKTTVDGALYTSIDERYTGLQFIRYAQAIDSYPDDSFDLVSVDGRARPACMRHAAAKIRPGGYLLLDNSERERYEPEKRHLRHWRSKQFFGPTPFSRLCSGTSIWQKPGGTRDRHTSV